MWGISQWKSSSEPLVIAAKLTQTSSPAGTQQRCPRPPWWLQWPSSPRTFWVSSTQRAEQAMYFSVKQEFHRRLKPVYTGEQGNWFLVQNYHCPLLLRAITSPLHCRFSIHLWRKDTSHHTPLLLSSVCIVIQLKNTWEELRNPYDQFISRFCPPQTHLWVLPGFNLLSERISTTLGLFSLEIPHSLLSPFLKSRHLISTSTTLPALPSHEVLQSHQQMQPRSWALTLGSTQPHTELGAHSELEMEFSFWSRTVLIHLYSCFCMWLLGRKHCTKQN